MSGLTGKETGVRIAVWNYLIPIGRRRKADLSDICTRSLLRFAQINIKKTPIRRFFTLQTPKAAHKSWFFRHKVPQKPTNATGCQYPDHWTQGETLPELEEMLQSLYDDIRQFDDIQSVVPYHTGKLVVPV
jgi:hypothetical protein